MTTVVKRLKPTLDVYTDGACSGAPGRGGWAWAADSGNLQDSGYEPSTTNQRMEMRAVLEAVTTLGPNYRVTIHSDSAYVINCFEERWYRNWRDGRKVKDGKPVANWDLWTKMIAVVLEHKVKFVKVKGHSGNVGNDYVDHLAVQAKNSGRTQV